MGKGAELAPVELLTPHHLAFTPKRAHNFSAGAAMFDTDVLAHMQDNFLSYEGSGMGIYVSAVTFQQPTGRDASCVTEFCAARITLTEPIARAGNESKGCWRARAKLHRSCRGKLETSTGHSSELQGSILSGPSACQLLGLCFLCSSCSRAEWDITICREELTHSLLQSP